jgi:hypothetical protein
VVCEGGVVWLCVEITPTTISAPIFLTRIESGDENGLGELQLSKDATELVYYNRGLSISGSAHRMVELNMFGLNGDHTHRSLQIQPLFNLTTMRRMNHL